MRGYSPSRIARELDYDVRLARQDVATVTDRYREFENLDEYLKDVTARTGEQLTKLNEQEAILWKTLDWCCEEVVQVNGFGDPIHEHDDEGEKKTAPLFGPRKIGLIPQVMGQIQQINKQQNELLGLLNKNVDITMKLQLTERIQVLTIEAIREADPETYRKIRRQIAAAQASIDIPALPSGGSGRSLDEVLDAQYVEVK